MTDVRILSLSLDPDEAVLDHYYDTLSAAERIRVSRFRSTRLRNRYVACRGALRSVLATELDKHAATLDIRANAYGKPFVPGMRLSFNVSHSDDRALIALAPDKQLGVDIERIQPEFATRATADRFFSAAESAALRSLPEHRQADAFFHCWTSKEAYVKARGLGLSIPLDSFDVSVDPHLPGALLRGTRGYSLQILDVGPGYAAAVVADGSDWKAVLEPFTHRVSNAAVYQRESFAAAG